MVLRTFSVTGMTEPERQLPTSFAVGDWLVDGDTLSVRRGDISHALEPRAFNVLRYLAERPGRLVTIDELMDTQWQGTVVTPNAVTRVVAQIRKALDDDAKQPTYIETVARTGYRLIADVGGDASPSRRPLPWAIAGVAIVLAALAWFFLADDSAEPSVAVYPFANFTGDDSLGYIGDGVAEEIINSLAKVPEFLVTSRSISFAYPDSGRDAQDFAEGLGVRYFVEGSVRRDGQTLRFTAQLIDVDDGNHVWSHTSEHDMQELFEGQDAISRDLTSALANAVRIEVPDEDVTATRVPIAEAYDLYLRGRQIWHRRGTVPLEPAVNFFAEAVKVDPEFARGWAALASAYITWPSYSPKGFRTWASAEDVAKKALELDAELAEPYGVLATFAQTRRQWSEAHRLYKEGVARNERNPTAQFWLSEHLNKIGHINAGHRHLRIALELDPLYKTPRADVAWAHLTFGDPADGLAMFEAVWEGGMQSMEPWIGRYFALIGTGRHADALDWLDQLPMPGPSQELHRRFLAILMGESDDQDFVPMITTTPRTGLDHRDIVQMTAMLGQYADTFNFVRWRVENGWWVDTMVLWGPGTDIRSQPDFPAIMAEIGLVDFWDEYGWGEVCRREASEIICDARDVDLSLLAGLEPWRND